jgi:hypothetical protein
MWVTKSGLEAAVLDIDIIDNIDINMNMNVALKIIL